jgi:hypothetical protein
VGARDGELPENLDSGDLFLLGGLYGSICIPLRIGCFLTHGCLVVILML